MRRMAGQLTLRERREAGTIMASITRSVRAAQPLPVERGCSCGHSTHHHHATPFGGTGACDRCECEAFAVRPSARDHHARQAGEAR